MIRCKAELICGDALEVAVATGPPKAPFPYFGGKAKVAPLVWQRLGPVGNYVEPFAGSLAVLLGRPEPFKGTETINDVDGFVANFWRALRADPEAVAHHADWPVNENDLHARHAWLVGQSEGLTRRLEGDPDHHDVKIAGWWVWGICAWIGSGFCSGKGPWQAVEKDGVRQLVHLGNAGRGVNRQLVHLGDAGQGVNRQRVDALVGYFAALADRLRRVRVCSGDWSRVCGPTPTVRLGLTAVFLDPPYPRGANRRGKLYRCENLDVGEKVRHWAIERGGDPRLRVALCGYDHFGMPKGWSCVRWKASGGYGSQGRGKGRANASREVIWFSPHCLPDVPETVPA